MIQNALEVTNQKGGVGKTSIAAHMAGLAAEAGYRVLTVDLDPQGALGRELGYARTEKDDEGLGLSQALQLGKAAEPIKNVRPGLDSVCGGIYMEDVPKLEQNFTRRGRDPRLILENALLPIADNYDMIVMDSPPGDRYLQSIGMCAANYVLVPTRSDDVSLDGLSGVAVSFSQAREVNPGLVLLGVVLFGIGSSATAVRRDAREKIAASLGDTAPVFDAYIRYLEAPAVAARNHGMLVFEYERLGGADHKDAEEVAGPEKSRRSARAVASAGTLATDYAKLTTEVLRAMAAHSTPMTREGASQ